MFEEYGHSTQYIEKAKNHLKLTYRLLNDLLPSDRSSTPRAPPVSGQDRAPMLLVSGPRTICLKTQLDGNPAPFVDQSELDHIRLMSDAHNVCVLSTATALRKLSERISSKSRPVARLTFSVEATKENTDAVDAVFFSTSKRFLMSAGDAQTIHEPILS